MSEPSGTSLIRRLREGGLDRRAFVRQSMLLLVGGSALGVGLAGCGGENGNGGGGFAETVEAARETVNAALEAMARATTLDGATATGYLNQLNDALAAIQGEAAQVADAELRGAVQPDFQEILDRLDGWAVPLDFSGAAPEYTPAGLEAAATRAEGLLQGLSVADRRATWAFMFVMAALFPGDDDAVLQVFVNNARRKDTQDVGGRVYDAVFGTGTASDAAAGWGLYDPPSFLGLLLAFAFLIMWGMDCHVATLTLLFAPGAFLLLLLLAMFAHYGLW